MLYVYVFCWTHLISTVKVDMVVGLILTKTVWGLTKFDCGMALTTNNPHPCKPLGSWQLTDRSLPVAKNTEFDRDMIYDSMQANATQTQCT